MALISVIVAADNDDCGAAFTALLTRVTGTFKVLQTVSLENITDVALMTQPEVILFSITKTIKASIICTVKNICPSTILVVASEHEDFDTVCQCLKAGVDTYLGQIIPGQLARILELVVRSRIMVIPRVAKKGLMDKLALPAGAIPVEVLESLTKREKEIYALIMQNYSNKQIAESLYISESTVKTHVRNVFRKIGISNRLSLNA